MPPPTLMLMGDLLLMEDREFDLIIELLVLELLGMDFLDGDLDYIGFLFGA